MVLAQNFLRIRICYFFDLFGGILELRSVLFQRDMSVLLVSDDRKFQHWDAGLKLCIWIVLTSVIECFAFDIAKNSVFVYI